MNIFYIWVHQCIFHNNIWQNSSIIYAFLDVNLPCSEDPILAHIGKMLVNVGKVYRLWLHTYQLILVACSRILSKNSFVNTFQSRSWGKCFEAFYQIVHMHPLEYWHCSVLSRKCYMCMCLVKWAFSYIGIGVDQNTWN